MLFDGALCGKVDHISNIYTKNIYRKLQHLSEKVQLDIFSVCCFGLIEVVIQEMLCHVPCLIIKVKYGK